MEMLIPHGALPCAKRYQNQNKNVKLKIKIKNKIAKRFIEGKCYKVD